MLPPIYEANERFCSVPAENPMAAMIDPERRVTRTGSAADDHLGRDGQHLQRKRLILHDVDLAAALLPAPARAEVRPLRSAVAPACHKTCRGAA